MVSTAQHTPGAVPQAPSPPQSTDPANALNIVFVDAAADALRKMAAERQMTPAQVVSSALSLMKSIDRVLVEGGEVVVKPKHEKPWRMAKR